MTPLYFIIHGYTMMRSKRELIIEKYNTKESFKKWKYALDVINNAVIIISQGKIIYRNNALSDILAKHKINTGNIINDVYFVY